MKVSEFTNERRSRENRGAIAVGSMEKAVNQVKQEDRSAFIQVDQFSPPKTAAQAVEHNTPKPMGHKKQMRELSDGKSG